MTAEVTDRIRHHVIGAASRDGAEGGRPGGRGRVREPRRVGAVAAAQFGVIANGPELRAALAAAGIIAPPDDDATLVAHVIAQELAASASPLGAIRRAVGRLSGTYALAVTCDSDPGLVFLARRGVPLLVGYGEVGEDGTHDVYAATHAAALAARARRVARLEEGDVAIISRFGAIVIDRHGRDVERVAQDIT